MQDCSFWQLVCCWSITFGLSPQGRAKTVDRPAANVGRTEGPLVADRVEFGRRTHPHECDPRRGIDVEVRRHKGDQRAA